jgi:hypothetical protein
VEGFPRLLRSCALRMGIRKKPEYVWTEHIEGGMERCSMTVYLGESQNYPNHRPFQVTFTGDHFQDTCQKFARKALRQLERELGLHLVPKLFWWLNYPTQIIGLTSLL